LSGYVFAVSVTCHRAMVDLLVPGPAPTVPFPLSLHDPLPSFDAALQRFGPTWVVKDDGLAAGKGVVVTEDVEVARKHATSTSSRSEEHTSELQSRRDSVCRLLLAIRGWECTQGATGRG